MKTLMNSARKGTQKARGFTLIEILVVIGIIAILAAIVIIAINPARQFAQARNTQRESAVSTILNAIGQNIADNKGLFNCAGTNTLPAGLATKSVDLGVGAGVDLSCLTPTYVSTFPVDPTAPAGIPTGYTVAVDAVGRVTVCAPNHAETAIPGSVNYCITR